MRRRLSEASLAVLGPTVACILLLGAWLFATEIAGASPYVLPSAIQVFWRLYDGLVLGGMYPHILATLSAAAIGYLLGALTAFWLGVLMVESPAAAKWLNPLLLAFQATPKVAVAPLIFIWVGFGIESTITLVALICLFPVFTNTISGLRSANRDLIDMYRVFSAGRWQIFWDVKLPAAAGQIFVGLQVSVLFALTGAVVMEFITGVQGMGYLIENSAGTLDVPTIFASLVVLAILGIVFASLLRGLHRRVVFWEKQPPGSGPQPDGQS